MITAMDFDGFYGTRVCVAASTRAEAADLATAEVVATCRMALRKNGFAYGMSESQADLDALIARKADVFHTEALAVATPVKAGAVVLTTPSAKWTGAF
jgi:hypothetical protein